MKHMLPVLLLAIISSQAIAQDDETLRRLHGTVVKDNLLLRWNDATDEFQYVVDNDTALWRSVRKSTLYNARNNHGNTVGFHIRFYNPLKYVTKSSFTDVEDPVYQALSQFLSNLPEGEALAGATVAPQLQEGMKLMAFAKATKEEKRRVSLDDLEQFEATILLFQWAEEFTGKVDYDLLQSDVASFNLFNALVKDINLQTKKTEDYLFREISISLNSGTEKKVFNSWVTGEKQMLFDCPADVDLFSSKLGDADAVLQALQQSRKDAEGALKHLQQLLTDDFNAKIRPLIREDEKESFSRYSSSAAYWLGMNFAGKADPQKEVLTKYDQLVTRLKKFTGDFMTDKKGYRLENAPSFDWKTQTIRNFVYEIRELDIEGNEVEKSHHTCEFTIAKDQAIVPFVSTGAFYTGFSYPNYAIAEEEGIRRVAETGATHVRVRPAVFLNMLFKTRSDWFYPFLQVGLSTGVNDFLVPFGGGLAISNRFSFSGGGILGYRKDLTDLKVGDLVKDDAELKNDMSNRGVVSWFISLNYNFMR
ncbi:hypothetical protein [Chitinophaga sp. XS-30]|uniref:hypothetical protein n=1 Tax=Chitinophaga sp. XS-30 TaxID=2604421 RepID=UPI0011DCE4E5|nr:hypothetical protein [Chitinophaga sp. XS-30]QEH42958.1 hypothetical protein FW415_19625 [Chitinophaga sp. XS-30]